MSDVSDEFPLNNRSNSSKNKNIFSAISMEDFPLTTIFLFNIHFKRYNNNVCYTHWRHWVLPCFEKKNRCECEWGREIRRLSAIIELDTWRCRSGRFPLTDVAELAFVVERSRPRVFRLNSSDELHTGYW